jgi:hypothetical protein
MHGPVNIEYNLLLSFSKMASGYLYIRSVVLSIIIVTTHRHIRAVFNCLCVYCSVSCLISLKHSFCVALYTGSIYVLAQ